MRAVLLSIFLFISSNNAFPINNGFEDQLKPYLSSIDSNHNGLKDVFLIISKEVDENQKSLKEKDLIIETSHIEINKLKREIASLKTVGMRASTQEIQ